jgi:hypothetical protein
MPVMLRIGLAGWFLFALAVPGFADPVDYLRDIKPLLRARCYACHGALQQKAKLRLDTATMIRKGGRHGPAIVPGKSGESVLIEAVLGKDRVRMPPEGQGEALSDQEIALLRKWIDQGANAPSAEKLDEDPRRHWAFQNPARPAVPIAGAPGWSRNPIDAFVAAEQAKHGLQPNAPASKETLLRRVYLDLIGLPPTRVELRAFLADKSENAYERVVDRLLESPQYGERWARHWMDVWRYSDWYGRRQVPDVWNSAPQVWRWRDWIVTSLNADKGYDRMLAEMLAADEIAPGDDEAAVATGYLVRNWYALNPNQWMRDIVEHTGKAFLGLTFNCAHCHDHKYDPITNEEYFRFRAFFEPIQVRQDRVAGEADPGPFQKYEYSVLRKVVMHGSISVFDERLDVRTYMYRMGDERSRVADKPPVKPGAPAFLGGDHPKIEPVKLPVTAYYPGLKEFVQREEMAKREQAVAAAQSVLEKADAASLVIAEARFVAAQADLRAIQARITADKVRYGRIQANSADTARSASKAERLAGLRLAEEKLAQADHTLSAARKKNDAAAIKKGEQEIAAARKAVETAQKALGPNDDKYTPLSPVYPPTSSGRRRALAKWIASKDNPLTARVAVNHLWMRHFGKPLVESVNDFGRNGKKPSHPDLLDWLAVEFMDAGWSMKHLHRLIVTGNTYRMQSHASGPNLALDAENRYLWHYNAHRAEAEALRDSILYAAGELDPALGGPVLENEKEATSRRRSLYFAVHPEDGGHLKMVELFDAPDPCDCYRRSESIVPQQALALTNGRLLLDASRLLARKLSPQAKEEPAFITAAFEQVLSRGPSAEEQAACAEFLRKQCELFRSAKPQTTKGEGSVAPSSDPEQRAREGLVRALFSHDDFVTIR